MSDVNPVIPIDDAVLKEPMWLEEDLITLFRRHAQSSDPCKDFQQNDTMPKYCPERTWKGLENIKNFLHGDIYGDDPYIDFWVKVKRLDFEFKKSFTSFLELSIELDVWANDLAEKEDTKPLFYGHILYKDQMTIDVDGKLFNYPWGLIKKIEFHPNSSVDACYIRSKLCR